eukprot:Sro721_g192750.1 Rhs element vgr protein (707) ;mRNA; r:26382-28502
MEVHSGDELHLALLPAHLSLRAETMPKYVSEVNFYVNGSFYMDQQYYPYSLGNDYAGNYFLTDVLTTPSSVSIRADPYTGGVMGVGQLGTSGHLNLVIINSPPTASPTDPPTYPPTNPPTETPSNPPTEPPTNPPTESPTGPPSESPTNPPTDASTGPPTNPPTDAPTRPPTSPPTNPPTDASTAYVESWHLVDADTDDDIGEVRSGDTLNLALLPPTLSIRAETMPKYVSEVNFYVGGSFYKDQQYYPYSLGGDSAGNYFLADVLTTPSSVSIRADPYTGGVMGVGQLGTSGHLNLVIINSPPTASPTDPPTYPPTNPPTETPSNPPTEPPTNPPTESPTGPPTESPTNPPTDASTSPPTDPPTLAPTIPPTDPPTNHPTVAPTSPPTNPPTDAPTRPPTSPPTDASTAYVESWHLVDADTDDDIGEVRSGDTLNLALLPPTLSIRAETMPKYVSEVNFYVGGSFYMDQQYYPYSLGNDRSGDYFLADVLTTPSSVSIRADPYTGGVMGVGQLGTSGHLNLVIINSPPTASPTEAPTEAPTNPPTESPTNHPTETPTESPTETPTESPTEAPTQSPTEAPTQSPTEAPTETPTESPTQSPTDSPTESPTESPTQSPTKEPTENPTPSPTDAPTPAPTEGCCNELSDDFVSGEFRVYGSICNGDGDCCLVCPNHCCTSLPSEPGHVVGDIIPSPDDSDAWCLICNY